MGSLKRRGRTYVMTDTRTDIVKIQDTYNSSQARLGRVSHIRHLVDVRGERYIGWRGSKRSLITVRLTRKFTDCLNGFDLSRNRVGDVLEVADEIARMLIAEGCAERAQAERRIADRRKMERSDH
jgi:hypothetical protein